MLYPRVGCKVKVKGLDIYIPPLTWTWPAAVYNSKWGTDTRWRSAI